MKRWSFAALMALLLALPAAAQTEREVRLSENARPTHYDLTVTPNIEALTFTGQVNIDLTLAEASNEITLNAANLAFTRVRLDERNTPQVSFNEEDQTATFTFSRPVTAGAHRLSIAYTGTINTGAFGLFAQDYENDDGSEGRMLATQFEAADFRRFAPSFDEPSFKATFDLTVVAPANLVVVSNMPEASSQAIAGGLKRTRFATTPLMSTYPVFLAVGDLERISQDVDGVLVSVYTRRGLTEQARFGLQAAVETLPWLNTYFGVPYPLPKLDIVAIPGAGDFAAMENWGAISYFETYLLVDEQTTSEALRQFIYTTMAHEIGHMWFGDLVTPVWWDDIWLNEGFASWIENRGSDELKPEWRLWDQAQGALQGAMIQDARPTSHPIIVPIANVDQAEQAFDAITYQKGFAVVRMLENHVGADGFRAGVQAYMRQYANQNTRSVQLWESIEAASGQPVRQIADDFTRQPGVPLITAETGRCRGGQMPVTLRQGEFTSLPVDRRPLLWHVPVTIQSLSGGAPVHLLTGDDRTASGSIACGAYVVNPGQVGYYRTRYPHAAFDQLGQNFARLDAADQLGLLYDTRALGRAGAVSAADFFALASRTPQTADPNVWALIAGELSNADFLYGDNDPRRERYRTFARGLLNPVFARVGWSRQQGESDNTSILRAALINALSQLEDPVFEAEALRRYNAGEIDGRVRGAVMGAVGASASPETFDRILASARASTSQLEKRTLFNSLAATRDRALAQRVLDLAFTEDVPAAFSPGLIGGVANHYPELAYDYAAAHRAEIAARLDPDTAATFLPGLISGSNDPAMLRRLRETIDRDVPATSRRQPEAQYAGMNERITTRERRLNDISAWVTSRGRSR
ncbi:M1 family metallopeptidase [Terricaulis silvestris]|uniref:Aminopeptidase n=1 Tax=Terricaulis silvestris TaxID=2686094 RepID=A0A6I6MWE3_9CAUL|nr:M1 family metallopeptidase [Terricaulis silvestris]QGZ97087.1 Aminopeptidase N [Terricaulis silvestris]